MGGWGQDADKVNGILSKRGCNLRLLTRLDVVVAGFVAAYGGGWRIPLEAEVDSPESQKIMIFDANVQFAMHRDEFVPAKGRGSPRGAASHNISQMSRVKQDTGARKAAVPCRHYSPRLCNNCIVLTANDNRSHRVGRGCCAAGLPRKPPAVPPEFAANFPALAGKREIEREREVGWILLRQGLLPNSQEARSVRSVVSGARGPGPAGIEGKPEVQFARMLGKPLTSSPSRNVEIRVWSEKPNCFVGRQTRALDPKMGSPRLNTFEKTIAGYQRARQQQLSVISGGGLASSVICIHFAEEKECPNESGGIPKNPISRSAR
ncbi:hypothetical protein WN55_07764 [Dufourea novaeangliae]|uniref:Uncharacterized protein n=1 Tax=Dufourea novaeangliae TaxID=178035 RepID=A0A154P4D1_DUFNO|nr:hypothetical protein WN55_07764 [Dufourea novaeangliae]